MSGHFRSWDHYVSMLDLLSDILTRLSLKGTLYFRSSFSEPWGVQVPAFSNVARFHYAHRGDCLIHLPSTGDTLMLAQGDLAIIPHGAQHVLHCPITAPPDAIELEQVIERSGFNGDGVLVWGGDGGKRDIQLICGHFSLAPGVRHMIYDRLPPILHIPNYGEAAGAWLDATLRVIGAEAGGSRLGGDLIALKMSEAIFAQAIRAYIERSEGEAHSLSGFGDRRLARALQAFHRNPERNWSIEALAREAGMSRTTFAVAFTGKFGVTPLQYMTSWRMQIARQALVEHQASVADAAALAGYASESAFSRVFKRETGFSPAATRCQAQSAGL